MYTKKIKLGDSGCSHDGASGCEHDDVYTLDEFKKMCSDGDFIDYDGFGYPVKDGFADKSIFVKPSKLSVIPSDSTHIIWFNR